MQKTGLIIEAESENDELNNFTIRRATVVGENWVQNKDSKNLNVDDANDWIDLMVEGITTVIYNCHDQKIKDSAEFLRETIAKLEQSFIKPSDTNVRDCDPTVFKTQ